MTPVSQRKQVIPLTAWVIASIILLAMFLLMNWIVLRDSNMPLAVRILLPVIPPLALAGWTLLIGYVYGDARRRGMRYVMWTLLAIFIPNGIGVILYFILRDPMPELLLEVRLTGETGPRLLPRLRRQHTAGVPAMPPCRPARLVSLRLVRREAVILPQRLLNRLGDIGRFRRHLGLEAGHHLAVLVHQKLGEIPLDLAAGGAVRNWYSGALSSPFTEIFEYMGKVTLYLLLQKVLISSLVPGSWPPKLLAGNPRIANPRSLYFS